MRESLRRWIASPSVHVLLLVLACFLVYSNNFQHDYQLDSSYTLLENQAVRHLSNIPRYFVDPSTYTSLREQVDYRPVLQITYALDYWLGGYETWWWHFTQILLHASVVIGLYFFGRRFADLTGRDEAPLVAFLAALVFAVHPASSGVVNYLNARSSLLAAAFLTPAIVLYMDRIEDPDYARPAWSTAILYAFALFTKVEAVGALGVFLAYEMWQRAQERREEKGGFFADLRSAFDGRSLRRAWPLLALTVIYTAIRLRLMAPYDFGEARHAADVGGAEYLFTQFTAWWYYLLRWIAPVHLVADYASYPVFRSILAPEVLLALGGWIAVVATLVVFWRRIPQIGFLAMGALALLAPTSSVAPLAEMVNEHRPYLAVGLLWIGAAILLGRAVRDTRFRGKALRWSYGAALGLGILALSLLTLRRNRVFATDLTYWSDVVSKAPSARAYLNYGLAMMRDNELDAAERNFERSLELAPNWYIGHINMALLQQSRGNLDRAERHFDRAVATDRYSGLARTYRAEFYLDQGRYADAKEDLEKASQQNLDRYRLAKDLATAYAGLGEPTESLRFVDEILESDPQRARQDIPGISAPFYQSPDRYAAGIRFYEELASRLPDEWWVRENQARLETLAGDSAAARSSRALAAEMGAPSPTGPSQADTTGPDDVESLMRRGLDLLYTRQEPAAAAETFREVLNRNPTHYGAHYQLAVALDRSGHADEARPVWEEVLRMAEKYQDEQTIETARDRLDRP